MSISRGNTKPCNTTPGNVGDTYIYIDENKATPVIISYTCVYASENASSAYYEWCPSNTNIVHTIQGDWTEENEEAMSYIQNKPKPVVIYHKDEDDTKYWCGCINDNNRTGLSFGFKLHAIFVLSV